MVLKNYKNWTYDEILDMYLDTGDKLFLLYLFIVKNKLDIIDLIELFEMSYEDTFLTVYNIQRRMDGLEPARTFREIDSLEHTEIDPPPSDEYDF